MSKIAMLDDLITSYQQLNYHQNAVLAQRLRDVQLWQKQRIQHTHAQHFAQKNHQAMANYFLERLYGSADFDEMASQVQRLTKHMHKVEKMIPEAAFQTGKAALVLAVYAVQLDEQVASHILENYPKEQAIDDEMMRQTYVSLDQAEARQQQLAMLDQLGHGLDHYLNSFMVQTAFKMCKNLAYKHRYNLMYDFVNEGFIAMKPLKSAEKFVQDFTQIERQIIQKVHQGDLQPFR